MKNITNLWPSDLGKTSISLPKEILLQQGRFLEEMTKNIIVVDVRTGQGVLENSDKKVMVHEFILKAPSAGNYQFTLLRVIHDFAIYPIGIYNALTEVREDAQSEEEFVAILSNIFNMNQTKNAINSLIAQSV